MITSSRRFALGMCILTVWCCATHGQEIALVPVSASGSHTIAGDLISLDGGGQTVFLELRISNWDPDLNGLPTLVAYQASLDSSGYSSGVAGVLGPALTPCAGEPDPDAFCRTAYGGVCDILGDPCTVDSDCPFFPIEKCKGSACLYPTGVGGFCEPGFIHAGRPDYVFVTVTDLPAVDLSVLDFRYASAVGNPADAISDPGGVRYAGTLVLDVPSNASGMFTIQLKASPDSLLQDGNNLLITPLALTSARIFIACQNDLDCDDGDMCTDDRCLVGPGTCRNDVNYNASVDCCNPVDRTLTQIDDLNVCTDDVCNVADGSVDHTPVAVGTSCGSPSDTDCDNPDTCDAGGVCASNLEPPGFACGDPANTECTNPDTCDGAGVCEPNHELPATACGDPTDTDCDNPDTCSGSGTCLDNLEPNGTVCDDSLFCNVGETCTAGACGGGSARDCSDGIACTTDTCDEVADVCDNSLDPGFCLITGLCQTGGQINPANDCEECNPLLVTSTWSARPGGAACGDGGDTDCTNPDTCNGTGTCLANDELPGIACGDPTNTDCTDPDTCDGGGGCLDNHAMNGTVCDDGLFCNVNEFCTNGACGGGNARNCSDAIGCTNDSCDEISDVCDNIPNDNKCNNGEFCDGIEICDDLLDCVIMPGSVPDPNDGIPCTDDSCDEVNDVLVNAPNDANCDNGVFCDGVEICAPPLNCILQPGSVPQPDDGVACTDDSCDEVNDVIVNAPNDALCPDDGLFCNGNEFCHVTNDCDHTGSPCGGPCDEVNDLCLCDAPIVEAVGNRYLRISIQPPNSGAQAIIITPDCPGALPMNVCSPTAFDIDVDGIDDENIAVVGGLCGPADPFRTPAEWGELYVYGEGITPNTSYVVQGDCGSAGNPGLSDPTIVTTPVFGDAVGDIAGTPPNGIVGILDTVAVIDRFQGRPTALPIYRVDHLGPGAGECPPNQSINVIDLVMVLEAFRGISYEFATACPRPCP